MRSTGADARGGAAPEPSPAGWSHLALHERGREGALPPSLGVLQLPLHLKNVKNTHKYLQFTCQIHNFTLVMLFVLLLIINLWGLFVMLLISKSKEK